jgi:hypothetical protein
MFSPKYRFTHDEVRIIVIALVELKNQLLAEGRYTDAKVDEKIAAAVKVETDRAGAAEEALESRLDAYDARFGGALDILVFDCGSSTTVI